MTWPIDSTVKLILGVLANITAVGLFASPVPTFVRIVKGRSTEDFSGLPYVVTLLNCSLWTFYGLPVVATGQILVSTINGAGTLAQAVYLLIFVSYASGPLRARTLAQTAGVVVLLGAVIAVTLAVLREHSSRERLVGIIADVVTILMYASPLGVMRLVIATKSVEFMPFYLSLNVFVNAMAWTVYAIYVRDIYVGIPNGVGMFLGVAQLVLYAKYKDGGAKVRKMDWGSMESGSASSQRELIKDEQNGHSGHTECEPPLPR